MAQPRATPRKTAATPPAKQAARKPPAGKAPAGKTTARKSSARESSARESSARKSSARNTTAKKSGTPRPAPARQVTAEKTATSATATHCGAGARDPPESARWCRSLDSTGPRYRRVLHELLPRRPEQRRAAGPRSGDSARPGADRWCERRRPDHGLAGRSDRVGIAPAAPTLRYGRGC